MNRGNSMGIFAILVLLGLGYFIPVAILAVEDTGRERVEKTIALDEIELDTSKNDVVEQLYLFPEMMFHRIVIQMEEGKEQENVQQSGASTAQKNDESNLKSCIQEFWQIFKGSEELIFEKFSYANYIMMANQSSDSLYSIWECSGVDIQGNEYNFWIDDISGKIVAFEIPYSCIGYTDGELYAAISRLSTYYGFVSYDFSDVLHDLSKQKYWENGINFYNESIEVKVSLPIYKSGKSLFFNIYPNSKALSETDG